MQGLGNFSQIGSLGHDKFFLSGWHCPGIEGGVSGGLVRGSPPPGSRSSSISALNKYTDHCLDEGLKELLIVVNVGFFDNCCKIQHEQQNHATCKPLTTF